MHIASDKELTSLVVLIDNWLSRLVKVKKWKKYCYFIFARAKFLFPSKCVFVKLKIEKSKSVYIVHVSLCDACYEATPFFLVVPSIVIFKINNWFNRLIQ